jgi:Family of unknown function (DUF6267)
MKVKEVLFESRLLMYEATVGRDLQHIEDNLIVGGSTGGINSLVALNNLLGDPNDASIKWDGMMAIYWGNDKNGNFYLVPNAQWSKGQILDKKQLYQEILNTGKKRDNQTDIEFRQVRKSLADKYIKLWDIFEKASKGTKGFYKGDIMFSDPQTKGKDGKYTFTPNKVTYVVEPNGLYGKMPTADAFVTVHGKANTLGSSNLIPASDKEIQQLNSTPNLIALNPQRPAAVSYDTKDLLKYIQSLRKNSQAIDTIVNYKAPGFSTIKSVLYNYAVKLGKSHDKLNFSDYIETAKLSQNHKNLLLKLMKTKEWKTFWDSFLAIKKAKHNVIDALHKQHGSQLQKDLGISSYVGGQPGGEGYVTKAGKLVNPHFRSAPDNPRFTGEI